MPFRHTDSTAALAPAGEDRPSRHGNTLRLKLQEVSRQRGTVAWILRPLSALFGALAAFRRACYRWRWISFYRVAVPVVVVGNVVAGGAGKTPVVLALVRHLHARGLQVGVISRGYGRRSTEDREVRPDSSPSDVGDEPALLHRLTGAPVFVARQRVAAARALLAAYPQTQVILSDDGLQHLALGRDIEICVFDDRGIGNGWLLPAGPLREQWPRPCDLVLHTGTQPAFPGYRSQRALADHAVRADGSRVPLTDLIGKPLVALAAIAKPEAFFDMLRAKNLSLVRAIALPDHYDFENWHAPNHAGELLICTEKDAVKLWSRAPDALAVPLLFEPETAFLSAFDRLLDAKLSSADGHKTA